MTATAPPGYHTLTPRIFTPDPSGLIEFLRRVFEANGDLTNDRPAEVRIGDSLLMISSTEYREAMPACIYVYVDDADETYRKAIEAGAESLEEPRDAPYGDRRAMIRDAWSNIWQIATHK